MAIVCTLRTTNGRHRFDPTDAMLNVVHGTKQDGKSKIMSLWDKIKDKANTFHADLKARASRFNNANFKNATMAICALVATADGVIQPEERKKVAACIGTTDALAAFDPMELKAQFDHYCDAINTDADFGPVNAMRAVAKLKGRA